MVFEDRTGVKTYDDGPNLQLLRIHAVVVVRPRLRLLAAQAFAQANVEHCYGERGGCRFEKASSWCRRTSGV
jgi:hypothetical protein